MSANEHTAMNFQPVIADGNLVSGFDPLKFLISTPSGPKLSLSCKKLWFHKKYLNGRIKLAPLRITDQLAIIEASVYLDRKDTEPATSYIAEMKKEDAPRGRYIEAAQDCAIEQALSNAGFDVQFMPSGRANNSTKAEKTAKQESRSAVPTQRTVQSSPTAKEEVQPPSAQPIQPAPVSSTEQKAGSRPPEGTEPQTVSPPVIEMEDFEEIIIDEEDLEQTASILPVQNSVSATAAAEEEAEVNKSVSTSPAETATGPVAAESKTEPVLDQPSMQPGALLSAVQQMETLPPKGTEPQTAATQSIQTADFDEIEVDESTVSQAAPPAYTTDTPVDIICSMMTLEAARNYVVKEGACNGWTLAQVEERRPASLKFYVNGYSGKDNILRAGAKLLLSAAEAKAS